MGRRSDSIAFLVNTNDIVIRILNEGPGRGCRQAHVTCEEIGFEGLVPWDGRPDFLPLYQFIVQKMREGRLDIAPDDIRDELAQLFAAPDDRVADYLDSSSGAVCFCALDELLRRGVFTDRIRRYRNDSERGWLAREILGRHKTSESP